MAKRQKNKKLKIRGGPVVAQQKSLTRNHEVEGSNPGLTQWVKDPLWLWLWRRPAATVPIGPLAWEPPYAVGVAIEKTKKKKGNVRKRMCVYIYMYMYIYVCACVYIYMHIYVYV